MPIAITNRQAKLSGEILSSIFDDSSTNITISDSYQTLTDTSVDFESDRAGDVLLMFEALIDKTTSAETDIQMQLLSDNVAISGSSRTMHDFGSTVGAQIVRGQWILDVSSSTTANFKVQIKKGNRDASCFLRYGGGAPVMVFRIIGL